jgi:hypothetical protein
VKALALAGLALVALPGCLGNECWTNTDATWHDPGLAAFARTGERWSTSDNVTWRGVPKEGMATLTVTADGVAQATTVAQERLGGDEAQARIARQFASVPAWPEPSFEGFAVRYPRACV